MSVSFILMSISGFLCTFGPQASFGVWPSYVIFVFARFLLACSTRGISVSGFVLGSEIGRIEISKNQNRSIHFVFQLDQVNDY